MTYPELDWGVISAFSGVWMIALAAVASWLYSTPRHKPRNDEED